MEIGDQFGHTGIQELHPAQSADVGFDHHGIHPSDPGIQFHHLGDLRSEIRDAIMIEVYVICGFIIITALTETGKGLITQWLFRKTGGMQGILISWIEHKVFHHLIIGKIEQFLDDQCTDNHVDRSIRPGAFIGIKDRESLFVDLREDLIREYLCPGIFQCLLFSCCKP